MMDLIAMVGPIPMVILYVPIVDPIPMGSPKYISVNSFVYWSLAFDAGL